MSEILTPIVVDMDLAESKQDYDFGIGGDKEDVTFDTETAIQPQYGLDYNELYNKPQVNSVELVGDKSFEDLGLEGITTEELQALLKR